MLNELRVDFDKNRGSFVKKPHLTQSELGLICLKHMDLFIKASCSLKIDGNGWKKIYHVFQG
jgi:hypothetical protein